MYSFQVPILFSLTIVLITFSFFICYTDSLISEPESLFDSASISLENDFFLDDDDDFPATSDPFLMDYNFLEWSELRGLAPPSFTTEDAVDFDAAFHESMLANAVEETTDYSGLLDAEFPAGGFGDDSFFLATETDWNWDCPDGKMPLCCTLRGVRTWDPRVFGGCRNCE
jgi:hypothetical protein